MTTATYEAGTMARKAIRVLERKFRKLLPDERKAIQAAGDRLEQQGATIVLQDHAERARTLCDFLSAFPGLAGLARVDGSCGSRDCSVHGDGSVRTDAADARARLEARRTDAWRRDGEIAARTTPCELRRARERDARKARERIQDARLDGATSKEDAVARYKRRIADQWRPQAKPQDPPAPARQEDEDDPVATARDAYHAAQREAWRKKG